MRFLLINDKHGLSNHMKESHSNLEIDMAFNLRDGMKLYSEKSFDLLLINITHNDTDTFQILSSIRQITPMLIVALVHPEIVEQAYSLFADVCIPEPVSFEILEACLEAQYSRIARLSMMDNSSDIPVIIRDMTIYPKQRKVFMCKSEINLTSREFDLLYYLARNPDMVLSPSQIYEKVWKSDIVFSSNLSSRISRLRRKIEPNPLSPIYIKTVNRSGYKLSSK